MIFVKEKKTKRDRWERKLKCRLEVKIEVVCDMHEVEEVAQVMWKWEWKKEEGRRRKVKFLKNSKIEKHL